MALSEIMCFEVQNNLYDYLSHHVNVFRDEHFNTDALLKLYTSANIGSDLPLCIYSSKPVQLTHPETAFLNNDNAVDDGEKADEVEAPIILLNIGDILQKVENWVKLLPRVQPFYAVKCNPDPMVIKLMSNAMQLIAPEIAQHAQFNEIGFDCASKAEISTITNSAGVSPARIIFAHTCKMASHLQYAREHGVRMMTFDSLLELQKIHQNHSEAQLLLRLRVRDSSAGNPLGVKFGCEIRQIEPLLSAARQLSLDVIGICFHVGSRATEATAYWDAIELARDAFVIGAEVGYNFTLLNIGGGFPGHQGAPIEFPSIAETVNAALEEFFPVSTYPHVRISAEPGRYFVASAFTLLVKIIGKKLPHENASSKIMYFVNDGIYGSFNGRLLTKDPVEVSVPGVPNVCHRTTFDGALDLLVMTNSKENIGGNRCSVWGPTCDGKDKLFDDIILPEQEIGDWLVFNDMGAYTTAAGSTFNGFPRPVVKAACSLSTWRVLTSRLAESGL